MDPTFTSSTAVSAADTERAFLAQVFGWMFLALALTTGVAAYLNHTGNVNDYVDKHPMSLLVLFAVQIGLVLFLSFAMPRISASVATALFGLYAGTVGLTFAVIFAVYTTGSVVGAFAGATGLFAGMATWGYVTKRDLSGWRGILFGALIGIIVASVANIWVGGGTLNLIIGWGGVLVFSALTAYDMQKIKEIGRAGFANEDDERKAAIFGALSLYLDFINLVISLLRIFGSSR
jgi:FtsH-binding integral membrane protein